MKKLVAALLLLIITIYILILWIKISIANIVENGLEKVNSVIREQIKNIAKVKDIFSFFKSK